MREYEKARFYCGCPRCGVKPNERCRTLDGYNWPRQNHPERNMRWEARKHNAKRGRSNA